MSQDNRDVFEATQKILTRRQEIIKKLQEVTDGDEYDGLHAEFLKSGDNLKYLCSLMVKEDL